MKQITFLISFVLLWSTPLISFAQDETNEATDRLIIIDGGFNLSAPLSPLSRNIDHKIFGFGVGAYFQIDPAHPYALGLDASYNYVDAFSIRFFENIDGQDVELQETTSSHIATFLAALKYFPEIYIPKLKPYVQFSLGVKLPFTQTYLKDTDGGEYINEYDVNQVDGSFTYGMAIGMNYQLSSFLFLNGKVSYLPGNSASYYSKLPAEEIQTTNFALDGFKKVNSTTPLVRYSVGVSFFL